jgi:hypothetical protein
MAEAVSEPCASYAEFAPLLRSILEGRYRRSVSLEAQVESVIHEWFHRRDGKAHERVVEAVDRSCRKGRFVDESASRRFAYGLGTPATAAVRLGQWARYAAGLSPNWSFGRFGKVPFRQKSAKVWSVSDVAPLVERIERARKAAGLDGRLISVRAAAERGDYSNGLVGHSVTLSCQQ